MAYKNLTAAIAALILALPVFADQQCFDGTVFDPDSGACVVDTDAGNGGGNNSGDSDDGTEPLLLRFLTPEDQDSFATGTSVTPTGRSSLALVQELPLDLTIILDQSGSMNTPTDVPNTETANPNDFFTQFQLAARALTGLVEILPESAEITLIHFSDAAQAITTKMGTGPFAPGKQAFLNRFNLIQPTGETRLDRALELQREIANRGALTGLFPPDNYDREILIMTDGEPTQDIGLSELFVLGGYGDVTAVNLPGSTPDGLAFLERLTQFSGGRLLDYSSDAQGFLDSFLGDNLRLSGLAGVEITDPNGARYTAELDALGQFSLDPFSLDQGDNVFTATATFLNGQTATDTLTLIGTGGTLDTDTGGGGSTGSPAPVPLPAAGWMLLAALGTGGALARTRKRN